MQAARRGPKFLGKFRSGGKFLWLRFCAAVAHLMAVALVVLASVYYPISSSLHPHIQADSEDSIRIRQLLLETLDYYVRYEHYYRELYGRYSRELGSLGVPEELSQGTLTEVRRYYEISVLENNPKHLLLLAHAQPGVSEDFVLRSDRITMDEHYRMNANFSLPSLSKKYLAEEADRVMQLKLRKRPAELGLAKDYWRFEVRANSEPVKWFAVGDHGPVAGMQRSIVLDPEDTRGLASIFTQVNRHFNLPSAKKKKAIENQADAKEISLSELRFLLSDARFAEHVHLRERGFYASDWSALDAVSGFHIVNRVKLSSNIELQPIELSGDSFQLSMRGMQGVLLGELFTMGEVGEMKEIRYTDILVKELQDSKTILQNSLGFQISEVAQEEEENSVAKDDKSMKKLKRNPSSDLP